AEDLGGPEAIRDAYLQRFADKEGRQYLDRFWNDYRGLSPEAALNLLASETRPAAYRLAVVFRSVQPSASLAEMGAFFASQAPGLAPDQTALADLYDKYPPGNFTLSDRGYLAGQHPLELWLVGYLQDHPAATRSDILSASTALRQEVYGWLFRTKHVNRQDW